MAKKDADLKFTLGVDVNKQSIEDAIQKAGELASKEFAKIRPAKLSVKATTPFEAKNPNSQKEKNKITKLNEAQSKLINHWNKQFEKGFHASHAYEEQLKDFYNSFKELSKGRTTSDQSIEIRDVIGTSVASYKKEFNSQLKKLTGFEQKTISNALAQWRREYYNNIKEKGEKRANEIADKKFIENLSRGTSSAKSKIPGSDVNLGLAKQTTADRSLYATEESSIASETSAYINPSKIAEAKHRVEEDKKTRKNLKVTANKAEANQMADAIVENAEKRGQKSYKTPLKRQYNTKTRLEPISGVGLASQQGISAKNALNDLTKTFKELENEKDVSEEEMFSRLDIAIKKSREAGYTYDQIDMAIGKKIEDLYTQSMRKALGGTTGEEKGVGPGHEQSKAMQRRLYNVLTELRESLQPVREAMYDFAEDVVKIDKSAKRKGKNSQWSKERQKALEEGMSPELDKIVHKAETITDAVVDVVNDTIKKQITDSNNDDVDINLTNKKELDSSLLPALIEGQDAKTLKETIGKPFILEFSKTWTKPFRTILDRLQNILTGSVSEVDKIMAMNLEQQKQIQAQRIETFGFSDTSRNPTRMGDKVGLSRIRNLWNGFKGSRIDNPFANLKITEGFGEINTNAINNAMRKSIQQNMFKAQTGGIKNNLAIAATGGLASIWQPSLEKSRSQVDALNTIMAEMRNVVGSLTESIRKNEQDLQGMIESGKAKFNADGTLSQFSSPEAQTVFAQLENSKQALRGVLADVNAVNQVVDKTGGNTSKIFRLIGFLSPELRGCNVIVQNINAGLNKGGKALRFQTRAAEILDYTFKSLGRNIGRMWKDWMKQLNPITQIKKAFQDFLGYNVKWQRTMNVIKYNLRAVLRPFMDWISQKIVDIIGFVDVISMKVQEAFGKVPVSLFDQAAADSEKIHEELEAAANVTAGFDELHDIGSDNTGANDLFGEIYKPELSPEWQAFAEKIGDLFAGVIKGDLGFGDAIKTILGIALDGIKILWGYIWRFLKDTLWPFIKDSWGDILGTLLKIFLGWQLLKVAGKLMWGAITSHLSASAFGGLLGKIGGGLKNIFTAVGSKLGGVFGNSFVSIAGKVIGGVAGALLWDKWVGASLGEISDNNEYNKILMEAGGSEKDKKSNVGEGIWATIKGTIAGAFGGFVASGFNPLGALIGAGVGGTSAGLLSLKRAFDDTKTSIDDMNHSLQSTSFYEGAIQGLKTQMEPLKELVDILNNKYQLHIDELYELADQYNISHDNVANYLKAIEDGAFSVDMLTGADIALKDSLISLSDEHDRLSQKQEHLLELQKKLQKAEMDQQVLNDITAGNYEVAAARVELAYENGLYTVEEAATKMRQAVENASKEIKNDVLTGVTDQELKTKLDGLFKITETELTKMAEEYNKLKKAEKEAYLADYTPEIQATIKRRAKAIEDEVKKHPILSKFDIGNDGKILGFSYINVGGSADGTNYVASDGLRYIHQGEAIVPKKYNPALGNQGLTSEERDYMNQMIATMRSLDNTMQAGIPVTGEFKQRGSDLVAVVQKGQTRNGNQPLSNPAYAR